MVKLLCIHLVNSVVERRNCRKNWFPIKDFWIGILLPLSFYPPFEPALRTKRNQIIRRKIEKQKNRSTDFHFRFHEGWQIGYQRNPFPNQHSRTLLIWRGSCSHSGQSIKCENQTRTQKTRHQSKWNELNPSILTLKALAKGQIKTE